MNKKKGIAAERELLHLLWQRGFACCRIAGSGSIPEPSCDLLAGTRKEKYAIEVKTARKNKKYIAKEQLSSFLNFAQKFGLKPLVAIKFSRKGWFFIQPKHLEKTKKGFVISFEQALKKGFTLKNLKG